MAEYRFRISPGFLDALLLQKTFFCSWGRIPHHSQSVSYRDGVLAVRVPEPATSGTLNVLCPHESLGLLLESTDTLIPRDRPYHFVKELCRGALGRLHRRLFEWQMQGFQASGELLTNVQQATRTFAAIAQINESLPELDAKTQPLLGTLANLLLALAEEVSASMLSVRIRGGERIPFFMAAGMGGHSAPDSFFEMGLYADELHQAFHALAPMPTWRNLEISPGVWDWEWLDRRVAMAYRYGFHVVSGPILDFREASLPPWIFAALRQERVLESAVERFVCELVERFDYATCLWMLIHALNVSKIPGLTLPRILALLRKMSGLVRERTSDKILMVGIDQPWGDANLAATMEQSPNQLVETLFSLNDIDAVVLETHLGLGHGDSLPRDPTWLSAVIDFWWHSGKNVFVSFSVPSAATTEEETGVYLVVPGEPPSGHAGRQSGARSAATCVIPWTEETQKAWVASMVPMLLSKRSVAGFFWSPLQDGTNAASTAHIGLIDQQRRIKPAFRTLASLKEQYVK